MTDWQKIIFTLSAFFIIIFLVNFASADFFDWFGKITGQATQQNTNASVTLNGTNGVTIAVHNFSAASPTENTFTSTTFYVQVTDSDGVSDINDTSINATYSFSSTGESPRSNATCFLVSDLNATTANYSCTVGMWYYDSVGVWNITTCAKDIGNMTYVCNKGASFTYNQLQALTIAPNSLTWATLSIGATNQTSNNDPTIINNTGNYNFSNISVGGRNLHGETTTNNYIDVANFTVGNSTGSSIECGFNSTRLTNGTNLNVKLTILTRGNNSVNNFQTGQEELHYCIMSVPQVTSQTYSTTYAGGSWLVIGTT